jgi:hypothetical protein
MASSEVTKLPVVPATGTRPGAEVSLPRLLSELMAVTQGRQFEMVARFVLVEQGLVIVNEGNVALTPKGERLVDMLFFCAEQEIKIQR